MENASKALLMAGGMLLAILLVSLLLYAWGLFSKYQSSQDSLAEIEDTAKFNAKFTAYDRNDVQGYELLSLLNQIIDYNERKTTDSINGNSDNYKYISITIDMGDETNRKKLTYNDEIQIFTLKKYTDNELTSKNGNIRTSFKKSILDKVNQIIENCGGNEAEVTNLAKKISSIFMSEDQIKEKAQRENVTEDTIKKEMLNEYNKYVSTKITNVNELILDNKKATNSLYEAVCAYYEYMQFKRGIFECKTLKYDDTTGRVSEITFEFTGKIH